MIKNLNELKKIEEDRIGLLSVDEISEIAMNIENGDQSGSIEIPMDDKTIYWKLDIQIR